MKLEEILTQWDKDARVDLTALTDQAADIPKLHAKYLRYFTTERMILRRLEAELRVLRLRKFEHYTQGPSPETKEWKLPASGRILIKDAPMYIDADENVTEFQMKVTLATEKVEALESIIKMINNRGYLYNSIMTHGRWTGGQ